MAPRSTTPDSGDRAYTPVSQVCSAGSGPRVPPQPPAARRRWLPALAVAGSIVAIVLGALVADAALEAPGAGTLAIGSDLSFHAAPGWVVTDDPTSRGETALQKGDARLSVSTYAAAGEEPREILDRYIRGSAESGRSARIAFGPIVESTIGGRRAARTTFTAVASIPVDGQVLVVVADHAAVLFEAVAPAGDFARIAPDVLEMGASIEVSR